jgi:hypothetical protein
MKQVKCRWHCGRATGNRSGICDPCWGSAKLLRSDANEGYKAWFEYKRLTKEPKPRTAKQQAHLDSLIAMRRAKLTKEMPQTGG